MAPNSRVLRPCSSTTWAAASASLFRELHRLSSLESLKWSNLQDNPRSWGFFYPSAEFPSWTADVKPCLAVHTPLKQRQHHEGEQMYLFALPMASLEFDGV